MSDIRLTAFLFSLLFTTSSFTIADNETEKAQEDESASDQALVITQDYKFQPAELTVQPGTTVRWENREFRQYHNVWFKQAGEEPGDYFFPGESVTRTFDNPGAYPYVCQPHEDRGMGGVIRVVE